MQSERHVLQRFSEDMALWIIGGDGAASFIQRIQR